MPALRDGVSRMSQMNDPIKFEVNLNCPTSNDLDETLPAPWEWDVKRLAASFVLACRENGLRRSDAEEAVLTCVRAIGNTWRNTAT